MRFGVGHLSRIDKILLRGAVVETTDLPGWAGSDERLHRVERLEPRALQRVKVDRFREIESKVRFSESNRARSDW